MSLATRAAALAVSAPASAQLLLPAAPSDTTGVSPASTAGGADTVGPASGAGAFGLRASSTSAPGTATGAGGAASSLVRASGASKLVPSGYRNCMAHFQTPHSGPP